MQENNIQDKRPVIGITMGDPAGIGPEIIVSALAANLINHVCNPVVLGDSGVIKRAVKLKGSSLQVNEISSLSQACFSNGTIDILNLSNIPYEAVRPGYPSKETGQAMVDYITRAVDLAMSGEIAAMVTAPITKTALKMAGSAFHGHTELIAHRTGAKEYAMMLAGEKLKVILVTIHIPLSEVSSKLSVDNIIKTIRVAGTALKRNFGIDKPVVAVAGLNPHAGEDGMFGSEEANLVLPAVEKAKIMFSSEGGCAGSEKDSNQECEKDQRSNGKESELCRECFDVEGPFPPDTVFYHAARGKYDCVVCMYHDQGLIPFKLLHFSDGVNTTLGLPIIRTSVDHGTAYDIAWKNRADHSSLVQAVKMAVLQARNLSRQ